MSSFGGQRLDSLAFIRKENQQLRSDLDNTVGELRNTKKELRNAKKEMMHTEIKSIINELIHNSVDHAEEKRNKRKMKEHHDIINMIIGKLKPSKCCY